MLRKSVVSAIGLFLILVSCHSAHAQSSQWNFLGSATVDGANDHDTIRVGKSSGYYRTIQLRVRGGTVVFQRVVVRFANGTSQEIPVRYTIPSGGSTRAIDLSGDKRYIQALDLWYSKAHWATRPKVSLYAAR